MLLKLKDGRIVAPVKIGINGSAEPSDKVVGIDVDTEDRDLFGDPAMTAFSISDIEAVYGSYSFAPSEYQADFIRRNRELMENLSSKPVGEAGDVDGENLF